MKMEFILHGDCLEVLRDLPDNSIDSVVTDPPYGLSKEPDISEVLQKWLAGEPYDHGHGGFMGKAWDSFVPHPDVWREVYRVLKPGGHALVFAGTRTQDLMSIALRLGGFEIRDVIEWLYFSGFPKSMDVGKAFDRRRDEDDEPKAIIGSWLKSELVKRGITREQLDERTGIKNTWQKWTTSTTDGAFKPRVPTWEQWESLRDWLSLPNDMDAEVWRLNGRKGKPGDAWDEREKVGESVRSTAGFSNEQVPRPWKAKVGEIYDITAPATELARKWDGWGTALKPAHEPVIVARKPLAGTVADTVEKHGTGALNIDGCRIGDGTGEEKPEYVPNDKNAVYGRNMGGGAWVNTSGRFPANCITAADDAFYSPYFNVTPAGVCKKASKKDRGEGNTHPTVKPTDLMAWLVRLVTPPGGVTLDPFAGSGSTLVAAKREGFGFIGIEREIEYVQIAAARAL